MIPKIRVRREAAPRTTDKETTFARGAQDIAATVDPLEAVVDAVLMGNSDTGDYDDEDEARETAEHSRFLSSPRAAPGARLFSAHVPTVTPVRPSTGVSPFTAEVPWQPTVSSLKGSDSGQVFRGAGDVWSESTGNGPRHGPRQKMPAPDGQTFMGVPPTYPDGGDHQFSGLRGSRNETYSGGAHLSGHVFTGMTADSRTSARRDL